MNKRHLLSAAALFLALPLILTACTPRKNGRYQAEFLQLFDTVTQIVGYANSREEFSALAARVYDELEIYHRLYDIYHGYEGLSNIKTINDCAGIRPVKVDKKILDLLIFGRDMYEVTGGKVNIAMGSVLSVWHRYREEGIGNPAQASLPPAKELQEAAQHTDITKIIIDKQSSTVYLDDPMMSLDVGAVAKGYALEQAARNLESGGMRNLLISVGGNVRAIGDKPDGRPWNVAVQNPFLQMDSSPLCSLAAADLSVVSSGDYQRYYTVDGRRYHHIIDPDTLMPSGYYASVTIVCGDSGQADALSTALYNMDYSRGSALIDSVPGTEALWVFHDGSRRESAGLNDIILPD